VEQAFTKEATAAPRVGANHLTVLRFALVLPVLALILQGRFWWALSAYAVAGLTDIADGIVARLRGETTQAGAVLDPLADIATTGAVFGALFARGYVPPWVLTLLGIRYGMLFAGTAVLWQTIGPIQFQATKVGKIVGVLQAAIAIIILVFAAEGLSLKNAMGDALNAALGILFAAVIVSQIRIGILLIRQRRTA
jgi:cardiolipin synthase (CMP-forming)